MSDTEPDAAERAALGAALAGVTSERERAGRLVRETWVAWAREQPFPKESWLTGWDELGKGQREVDIRIGEKVALAERERIAKVAEDLGAHYHGPDYDRTASFSDYRRGAKA